MSTFINFQISVGLGAYFTLGVALLLATFLSSGLKLNAAKVSSVIQRVPLIVFRNENTLQIKFIISVKSAILYFW